MVAYVPPADVRAATEPAERETYCPYKGEARYWTVAGVDEAAWSYEYPRPECTGVAGYLAFDATKATVTLG